MFPEKPHKVPEGLKAPHRQEYYDLKTGKWTYAPPEQQAKIENRRKYLRPHELQFVNSLAERHYDEIREKALENYAKAPPVEVTYEPFDNPEFAGYISSGLKGATKTYDSVKEALPPEIRLIGDPLVKYAKKAQPYANLAALAAKPLKNSLADKRGSEKASVFRRSRKSNLFYSRRDNYRRRLRRYQYVPKIYAKKKKTYPRSKGLRYRFWYKKEGQRPCWWL